MLFVVNSCTWPVSSSTTDILYDRMMPFCRSANGASHLSVILVELAAPAMTFCGTPVGSVGM